MKVDKELNLLMGLAKNDRKAIETIYRENYNIVQALVVKNNGTAEDAKDVFQEAMIVLYEKSRQENFELQCQLRTYLYSVCRRIWLKRLLQQNRFMIAEETEVELAQVEDDIEEQERLNTEFVMMERAVNSLGEPCKSLLDAFYLQKRNMQDIALSFGYTNAENAKNQKYKCLIRLKKLFFSQYNNSQS